MIQRIQSVYLLLIAVLSIVVLFSPVVEITKGTLPVIAIGTWIIPLICILNSILALITLFLFKKRLLQIRLCILNMILMIGYYLLLIIYIYTGVKNGFDYNLPLTVLFPLIELILSYLAIRGIRKDEALIKSLNRMR